MTPIRTQVRDAVRRAWDRAIADGTLPPLPDDAPRPPVEVEHPAEPEHGDFASNLAMKLARPYRMAPLAIAEALKTALRRARRRRPGVDADRLGRGRPARVPQPAPDRPDARGGHRGHPPRAGGVGPRDRDAARRQRRVRVGQPDRAAPHRQRPRRVRRRPAEPRPRGRRPAGDARVLLQRLGRPDPEPRRVGRRRSGGASRSPRTATRATTCASSRTRCPTTSGRRRPRRTPTRTASSGTGRRAGSARASRPA